MRTILDLPKYIENYKIVYFPCEVNKSINTILPNHDFFKINFDGLEKVEQLDRYLKLNLLLSDNKLFLIDSLPIINGLKKYSGFDEKYYKCIADNFKNSDAKLVILLNVDYVMNSNIAKMAEFIAKINKTNSVTIIKNKYNYYINNWK